MAAARARSIMASGRGIVSAFLQPCPRRAAVASQPLLGSILGRFPEERLVSRFQYLPPDFVALRTVAVYSPLLGESFLRTIREQRRFHSQNQLAVQSNANLGQQQQDQNGAANNQEENQDGQGDNGDRGDATAQNGDQERINPFRKVLSFMVGTTDIFNRGYGFIVFGSVLVGFLLYPPAEVITDIFDPFNRRLNHNLEKLVEEITKFATANGEDIVRMEERNRSLLSAIRNFRR